MSAAAELLWGPSGGHARTAHGRFTLAVRPRLPFDFDELREGGLRIVAGEESPLSDAELAAVQAWLDENDPNQNAAEQVHAADADGRYVGLVDRAEAVVVVSGPPPEATGWTWVDGCWVRAETPADVIEALTAAVQKRLDAAAQALGYDDIRSAVTYADEPTVERFQREGLAMRAWRSQVWAYCYQVLDDVKAGRRTTPTPDGLIGELPVLVIGGAA